MSKKHIFYSLYGNTFRISHFLGVNLEFLKHESAHTHRKKKKVDINKLQINFSKSSISLQYMWETSTFTLLPPIDQPMEHEKLIIFVIIKVKVYSSKLDVHLENI